MQHLIEALLHFSRIDSFSFTLQKTDLNLLLEEAKKDLQELVEEKKALIEADQLPELSVVPLQIQQVFSNILGNSLKYRQKDRPLSIRITSDILPSAEYLPDSGKGTPAAGSVSWTMGLGSNNSIRKKYLNYFSGYMEKWNIRVQESDWLFVKRSSRITKV